MHTVTHLLQQPSHSPGTGGPAGFPGAKGVPGATGVPGANGVPGATGAPERMTKDDSLALKPLSRH